jgi:hypothetical protein
VKLNLADIQQKDFSPVPAGKYSLRFTDYEMKEVGENAKPENVGEPIANCEFTIIAPQEFEGKKVWSNFMFTPKTLWRLQQFLASTGQYSDDELSSDDFDFELQDLIGSEVVASIKFVPETDQYEAKNEIKKFFPSGTEVGSSAGASSLLP